MDDDTEEGNLGLTKMSKFYGWSFNFVLIMQKLFFFFLLRKNHSTFTFPFKLHLVFLII